MNRPSRLPAIIGVAGVAALLTSCGGLNSQTKKVDLETEERLAGALSKARDIKYRCMDMLQDGTASSTVEETPSGVNTDLRVTKESTGNGAVTEQTCDCRFVYDTTADTYSKKSCSYSYVTRDGKRELLGSNSMSTTDKPDGRSFAGLDTSTTDTTRKPIYISKDITTEMPEARNGCRVGGEEDFKAWEFMPYIPEKTHSCSAFASGVDELIRETETAICDKLKREKGDEEIPPLCAKWRPTTAK